MSMMATRLSQVELLCNSQRSELKEKVLINLVWKQILKIIIKIKKRMILLINLLIKQQHLKYQPLQKTQLKFKKLKFDFFQKY